MCAAVAWLLRSPAARSVTGDLEFVEDGALASFWVITDHEASHLGRRPDRDSCASTKGTLLVDGRPFVPTQCHTGENHRFLGVELADAFGNLVRQGI